MSSPRCITADRSGIAQLAAVGSGPLKHRKMPASRCITAGVLVPPAAVGSGPLQHRKMPASRCIMAGVGVPPAAVAPGPLTK
eukprot:COSAG06_NODE_50829_length_316_cov_0.603687_1_plen_81_part_01